MEQNLRRALSISNGDATILVCSPIAIGLWLSAGLMLVLPMSRHRPAVGVVEPAEQSPGL